MNRLFTLSVSLLLLLLIFSSCTKKNICGCGDSLTGNWVKRADFDGAKRSEATSMVIGDSVYIVAGTDGINFMKDCWQYDADKNTWKQRADFPGDGRSAAIAFSVGTKGYFGTGYNGRDKLKDVWEYNPALNVWTRKADFIGSARYDATAFAISNKGYITTGFDGNDLNDFYTYNPAGDTAGATTSPWIQLADMPGAKRSKAAVMVYNGKAYLYTGVFNSNGYPDDMWVFDAANGGWSKKRAISNASPDTYDDNYAIIRSNAVSFVAGDFGYLSCGENGTILKSVWEYNFATDTWLQKTAWEGVERTGAAGFTIKNRSFLVGGRNSKYYFDDMRQWFANDAYDVND